MLDARLADGKRVNAIVPPLALGWPGDELVASARFRLPRRNWSSLMRLRQRCRYSWKRVSGARSTFWSPAEPARARRPLLNVRFALDPNGERVVTIEDAAELQLQRRHTVRLETAPRRASKAKAK